jgi:hypothetical protein
MARFFPNRPARRPSLLNVKRCGPGLLATVSAKAPPPSNKHAARHDGHHQGHPGEHDRGVAVHQHDGSPPPHPSPMGATPNAGDVAGTARQLPDAWHVRPGPSATGYVGGRPQATDTVPEDMTDRLRFAFRLAALASEDGRHCKASIRQIADEAGCGSVPDGVAIPGCAIKRAGWLRARRSLSV